MSTSSRDVVLPEWQADSEVPNCPICHRTFHFLYRKHHCRRCGRIICDQCSPHRITLPRQYIVRSPTEALRLRLDGLGLDDGEARSTESLDPALGGGETVRVCNPCVPDPNYGPPPQQDQESSPVIGSRAATSTRSENEEAGARPQDENVTRTNELRLDGTNAGSQRYQPQQWRQQNSTAPSSRSIPRRTSDSEPPPYAADLTSFLLSQQRTQRPSNTPKIITSPTRHLPPPRLSSLAPTLRNQVLREEDECPVCGTRNPPFGPNPVSSAKERHIEECISQHLAFAGPSRASPATSSHLQRSDGAFIASSSSAAAQSGPLGTAGQTTAAAATTTSPSRSAGIALPTGRQVSSPGPTSPLATTAGAAGAAGSPVATSPHPRPRPPPPRQRMLIYHATEKDCFSADGDDDGEAQECVICFEEFQPGDEMGRLECLCKFHRACIRAWWEEHWGSCPTHQLHD